MILVGYSKTLSIISLNNEPKREDEYVLKIGKDILCQILCIIADTEKSNTFYLAIFDVGIVRFIINDLNK